MTDSKWTSAPPFDHVLYGLPEEVAAAAQAPEQQRPRRRRRKVLTAALGAVVALGGMTAAYTAHERSQQADAVASKVAADAPEREDLQAAVDLEEALTELQAVLDDAREVSAAAGDLLDDEANDLRADLDEAIAAGDALLAPDAEPTLDGVARAKDDVEEARTALEDAMLDSARSRLAEVLEAADAQLTRSAGWAPEEDRLALGATVDRARALLESDEATPAELVELAGALDEQTEELTAVVDAAVAAWTAEQQAQVEQPAPPEYVPPARDTGRDRDRDDPPADEESPTPSDEPSTPEAPPSPDPADPPAPDPTPSTDDAAATP